MTANFTGLAAICASVVAFFITWQFAQKRALLARTILLVTLTLFSAPALLVTAYYRHILPEEAWFYTVRSWSGSEFLAIFPGCAGGCAAAFLPRLLFGFPLFATTAVVSIPYLKPILSPIPDAAFSDQWKGGACLQSTLATCGPASICTILKFLGTNVSERQVAKAAFSYTGGTEAWYLARFTRARGYTPKFDFHDTFCTDVPFPALVGVRNFGMGHFIAVLAVSGGQVTFADPMAGMAYLPLDQFRRRYDFTGFHLSILKRGN